MGWALRQIEPAPAKWIRRSIRLFQRKNRVAGSVKLSETRTMITVCKFIASPVGTLELVARGDGLAAILWENDAPNRVRLGERLESANHPILLETERQLAEYFAGERTEFSIRLDLTGTAFQKAVWQALLTIPFGETRTYATIARQIGHPKAYRAMGAANGRNPVSIIVPCHRAIGSDGQLHGFAGGLEAKRYLLALERKRLSVAA
jgi:methylated-DNA-[protein]-cysteine S-methyltransferase